MSFLKLNYSDSIYVQNIYLYIYGSILNLIVCLIEFEFNFYDNETKSLKLLNGFNYLTWIIIFTQCFNGFLMSIVMKHSNNITRLFVISCSLIVTAILSVLIFSLKLNFYFYSAFFITSFYSFDFYYLSFKTPKYLGGEVSFYFLNSFEYF
jgi:probable UDP-sugar transporter A4